jgi:Uma2 family endonuclease
MNKARTTSQAFDNVSDLLEHLGDIPPQRIRLVPAPGTATEQDAIHAEARCQRLCELVDGTLVEKPMGWFESRLALLLGRYLDEYLEQHDLGFVTGESGMTRIEAGQIRMPDVAFYAWEHFPKRVLPRGAILAVVPDLAIEVLSPSNTKAEMARKRREYFLGGCRLVWEVDPEKRRVRVYTSPEDFKVVRERGTLDGGELLPGFRLPLAQLFARAGRRQPE